MRSGPLRLRLDQGMREAVAERYERAGSAVERTHCQMVLLADEGRSIQEIAWLAEVHRVIDLDPHTVGVDSAVWTTRLLADYLERMTGHRTGIEAVRVHLHRLGYVCKRPTWSLKRKSTDQAGWVKNG